MIRREILSVARGGIVLIGKAAVLKTAARKRLGVRVPLPPLQPRPTRFSLSLKTMIPKLRSTPIAAFAVSLVLASCSGDKATAPGSGIRLDEPRLATTSAGPNI